MSSVSVGTSSRPHFCSASSDKRRPVHPPRGIAFAGLDSTSRKGKNSVYLHSVAVAGKIADCLQECRLSAEVTWLAFQSKGCGWMLTEVAALAAAVPSAMS